MEYHTIDNSLPLAIISQISVYDWTKVMEWDKLAKSLEEKLFELYFHQQKHGLRENPEWPHGDHLNDCRDRLGRQSRKIANLQK